MICPLNTTVPPRASNAAMRSAIPASSTTAGTVLLHSGANLLAYGTSTGTRARIVPQLIAWVAGAHLGVTW